MNEGFPEHDGKSRFPKKQPKGICRGCRCPITEKRRQPYRWEKFVEVAEAAMARRKVKMSAGYRERLKRLAG